MSRTHDAPGGHSVPCWMDRFGECRTCQLIDRDGPHYREAYRRLYFPDEFPAEPPRVVEEPGVEDRPDPSRLPDIPLAGDVLEALAKRVGADRLAKWWERKTGRPCNCEGRKLAMNEATRKLLKWAGLD